MRPRPRVTSPRRRARSGRRRPPAVRGRRRRAAPPSRRRATPRTPRPTPGARTARGRRSKQVIRRHQSLMIVPDRHAVHYVLSLLIGVVRPHRSNDVVTDACSSSRFRSIDRLSTIPIAVRQLQRPKHRDTVSRSDDRTRKQRMVQELGETTTAGLILAAARRCCSPTATPPVDAQGRHRGRGPAVAGALPLRLEAGAGAGPAGGREPPAARAPGGDVLRRGAPLWQRYEQACDFLEDDLESGYVRVLQEMIAAGWSNRRDRRGGPRRC